MDICIDFDGTCVTHSFPHVGEDIGAAPVLKELVENGHRLILFTMRSNTKDNKGFSACVPEVHNGNFLDDAVNWFKKNEIPLYGIQENPQQKEWTTSPKAYGQMYIDDAAFGCPLRIKVKDAEGNEGDVMYSLYERNKEAYHNKGLRVFGKPFVDWGYVRIELVEKGIIKNEEE